MKKRFTFIFFLLLAPILVAQTFERMDVVSGFTEVGKNNGVAVADFDQDLDLDIFIVAKAKDNQDLQSQSRLFRNNNDGSFSDVTQEAGLTNLFTEDEPGDGFFGLDGFKFGASWGDFNNDGFPDLFLTNTFKVQLFKNNGDNTFTEITEAAGFPTLNNCRNTGATWFDYNNDGLLDIYLNDWEACPSNTLFRNNGDETFTDVTFQTQILAQEDRASYTGFPFHFNNDEYIDLYVTNDFDDPNDLFINEQGNTFTQEAQSYGVDSMADDMGVAIGDYNLDGNFDFFITAIDKNILLTNNGNNTFTDEAAIFGLDNTGWAWGTRFADFDLDGDEDLFVVNGYDFEDRDVENNVYFKNFHANGSASFSENTSEVQLEASTISVEAVDFDYDNDGDLDLFVTNSDSLSYFYENKILNFDEPSTLGYFKVQLEGTISNRNAIGTKLVLNTSEGNFIRYFNGIGFLSQSILPVHFGLNENISINDLTITWPTGLVETHQNLDRNTTIKATEGEGFIVLDIDPSYKIYGCTDPNSCSYNPEATLNDGTCTYLPPLNIQGAANSGFYRTETYEYAIPAGSLAQWSVIGGELVSGQGSSTIEVRWGIGEIGVVSVIETNSECSSLEQLMEVNLFLSEQSDDVSIARIWNEVLLEAIRGDFARPTVHARNLFHASVAMYDAWAIYDEEARPYLIGNTVNGFSNVLDEFIPIDSKEESRKQAISYAMYVLINHRFQNAPAYEKIKSTMDLLMAELGYSTEFIPIDYRFGNAIALGNHIAQTLIEYGQGDNSRENSDYDNSFYEPINEALAPTLPGNETMQDPNRWQPLSLDTFIDQSGNIIEGSTPQFLSPEWGNVYPFALDEANKSILNRDGDSYSVYFDPAAPPYLNLSTSDASSEAFKWGFSLVSAWASHHDPTDGIIWDISPASIGNLGIESFPTTVADYEAFYNFDNGGDPGNGHDLNPVTNQPYSPQLVPRGDYTRVLAEFWADGPDSETPPGHWFTILNYVNDHPQLQKKLEGEGETLGDLEWDVKAYFMLGGAMHDAAIAAWGVKGFYDYVRPISAIRYMANLGQSSDSSLDNYNLAGIPLVNGLIEPVIEGDPLAGLDNEHVGKIKLYTWRGPDFIENPSSDQAGVGWILAENWWPYQRPSFVTPPFAGYISGHSTYSRAAAEVLTRITGSPYFPGGLGEFVAKKDVFLVFEEGPSVDVRLQWATYRDASDQCSLSRIWGGIHPPADDIPGRLIGENVGINAIEFALPYFKSNDDIGSNLASIVYPNPISSSEINITNTSKGNSFELFDVTGRVINIVSLQYNENTRITKLTLASTLQQGVYILRFSGESRTLLFEK